MSDAITEAAAARADLGATLTRMEHGMAALTDRLTMQRLDFRVPLDLELAIAGYAMKHRCSQAAAIRSLVEKGLGVQP